MPIFAGNPNVGTGGAPVATPPMQGQYPGGNRLLQDYWMARRQYPWMFPPEGGLLHQVPDVHPEDMPYTGQGSLLQPAADIYNFPTKKGLLAAPSTEGAGGRGLGPRGGGGMLGSKWRDPGYIQQYEVQQGLPPGSIKPPGAEVRQMPTQLDAVYKKAQAAHEAEIARRIEARTPSQAQLDARFKALGYEKPLTEGEKYDKARAAQAPTTAQMARPVRMTPEIAAKLQQARDARAGRGMFAGMSHDLWGKMPTAERQAWLRDAKWQSWPVEQQRIFIERFMPKGIGP